MKVASMTMTARKLSYDLAESKLFLPHSERRTRQTAKHEAKRLVRREAKRHIQMDLAA